MTSKTRCRLCILPASYPGIQFNQEGICNYCMTPSEKDKKTKEGSKSKLDELIKIYKGRSPKFDVIVGMSGGKDSTYVAYYLKKQYDVRILGVNIDIGYRSSYAIQNLAIVADKLGIDLLTIRPNKDFLNRLFAHFLRERGEFCSVCNNFGYLLGASLAWNQKRSLGFSPLMVGGWAKKYEYQPGVSVTSMQYFFQNLTEELLEDIVTHPFIEKEAVSSYMKITDPRQAKMDSKNHGKSGKGLMNLIQLPEYIPWNIREIPHILEKELGWKHPPDVHESHFDCALFPIKEYLKLNKYGLTQETIKNSVLIREGLMSRDEALERMSLEQTIEPENFESFLRELKISKKDVNWQGEWSK